MTPRDEEPERGTDDAAEPLGEESPAAGPELLLLGQQFTSSPRGARLARRLAVRRMGEWGWPPASDTSCTVALLVGELAANAVHHGRVPGRDFQLCLSFEARTRMIRIEVSDASPDRPPISPQSVSPDDESGRGLLLVNVLAIRWGATPRDPVGKTVWAEVAAETPSGLLGN
jgi:anti-sigma regulatory factor (Ser/Thr protein kinase)